jgi:hypothetical protein
MSAPKWCTRSIPICKEKGVMVWGFSILRMVCSCKMRVQQKVGLHCEGGCSFHFLLTSPQPSSPHNIQSTWRRGGDFKLRIVLTASCRRHIYAHSWAWWIYAYRRYTLFCERIRGVRIWNTVLCQAVNVRLLGIYLTDTVSPWRRQTWVYCSHNICMQSLGSVRSGTPTWWQWNWAWVLIFHL